MVDLTLNQIGNKVKVASWNRLQDRAPEYALVANVDLVVFQNSADALCRLTIVGIE